MPEGIITEGRGGLYTVCAENGEKSVLRARKKFRHQHISPLVGDHVSYTPGLISDEHGWIDEIHPRINASVRPPVANISLMLIVAAEVPVPDWLLIDKLLLYAFRKHILPVLVINKEDILPGNMLIKAKECYRDTGITICGVSAKDCTGTKELKHFLKGHTVCVCGQSGVGKSSLINCLCGSDLETGEISLRIERGKNTTRHCELMIFPDFNIIDTPGFSLLEENEKPEDPVLLQDLYPEFSPYLGQCHFQPCYHWNEPGCAILQAAKDGVINPERINRYHELLQAARERWNNRFD